MVDAAYPHCGPEVVGGRCSDELLDAIDVTCRAHEQLVDRPDGSGHGRVCCVSDVVYETERCLVRDWRPGDEDRMFDLYRRMEVAKWLGSEPRPMQTREEAERGIARWAERNAELTLGGIWAVQHKPDGLVAGTVLLVPIPDSGGEYEVGWHFHPDSWGQGLATESARGALEFAWAGGLREVLAVVLPGNDASMAVCTRLGMEPLGVTDRYYSQLMHLFRIASPI
jgi:RimJ/RimL family protein N-acetyltransferase